MRSDANVRPLGGSHRPKKGQPLQVENTKKGAQSLQIEEAKKGAQPLQIEETKKRGATLADCARNAFIVRHPLREEKRETSKSSKA
jgi:hypothetical protein